MNATTAQLAPEQALQAKEQMAQLVQSVPAPQAKLLGICADKVGHNGISLLVRETKRSKRYEVLETGTKRKLLQIKTNFFTMHMRKEAWDIQDKDQPRHLFDMVYDYSGLKRGDLLTSFAIHYPKQKKDQKKDQKKEVLGDDDDDDEAGDQDPENGEKIVDIKGNFKLVGSKSTVTFKSPLMGGWEECLEMGGNLGAFKGEVTDTTADNKVVARFERDYGVRDFFLAKQQYNVSVEPGVDWALMALLCVAMDHRSDAWWGK
ncbi:hypothetical protein RB595_008703 [Gaeumannomyces hyphopodioides]